MSLVLIHPAPDEGWADMRLAGVLSHALAGRQVRVIRRAEELNDLTGQRLLFAAALGKYGVNLELTRMLSALRRTPDLLSGATAGIIIDGLSPLYTKSAAGELALAANLAGCALVGRPLVEGAGQLHNFRIQAKNAGTDLLGAYRASAADLAQRVETAGFPARERPELLVLHASSHHTSNTMALWERTKAAPGGGHPVHRDRSAQRHPVRLLRLSLYHVPALWGAGGLLLRRRDAGGSLSRPAPVRRGDDALPQL